MPMGPAHDERNRKAMTKFCQASRRSRAAPGLKRPSTLDLFEERLTAIQMYAIVMNDHVILMTHSACKPLSVPYHLTSSLSQAGPAAQTAIAVSTVAHLLFPLRGRWRAATALHRHLLSTSHYPSMPIRYLVLDRRDFFFVACLRY